MLRILRRIINRKPISEADKNHTHHKLMRKGFSHRTTVLILYAFGIGFGILGIFISRTQQIKYIYYALILLLILIAFIFEKNDIKSIGRKNQKDKK